VPLVGPVGQAAVIVVSPTAHGAVGIDHAGAVVVHADVKNGQVVREVSEGWDAAPGGRVVSKLAVVVLTPARQRPIVKHSARNVPAHADGRRSTAVRKHRVGAWFVLVRVGAVVTKLADMVPTPAHHATVVHERTRVRFAAVDLHRFTAFREGHTHWRGARIVVVLTVATLAVVVESPANHGRIIEDGASVVATQANGHGRASCWEDHIIGRRTVGVGRSITEFTVRSVAPAPHSTVVQKGASVGPHGVNLDHISPIWQINEGVGPNLIGHLASIAKLAVAVGAPTHQGAVVQHRTTHAGTDRKHRTTGWPGLVNADEFHTKSREVLIFAQVKTAGELAVDTDVAFTAIQHITQRYWRRAGHGQGQGSEHHKGQPQGGTHVGLMPKRPFKRSVDSQAPRDDFLDAGDFRRHALHRHLGGLGVAIAHLVAAVTRLLKHVVEGHEGFLTHGRHGLTDRRFELADGLEVTAQELALLQDDA